MLWYLNQSKGQCSVKIDEGRLFHCVVVLGKKERRSELVKVRKGKKLSGWACLVFGYTGRRRTFVSTETSSRPRMMLNSVERFFQLFTWTSKRKSIDTAGESGGWLTVQPGFYFLWFPIFCQAWPGFFSLRSWLKVHTSDRKYKCIKIYCRQHDDVITTSFYLKSHYLTEMDIFQRPDSVHSTFPSGQGGGRRGRIRRYKTPRHPYPLIPLPHSLASSISKYNAMLCFPIYPAFLSLGDPPCRLFFPNLPYTPSSPQSHFRRT